MQNNTITSMHKLPSYLARVRHLKLSNNRLETLSPDLLDFMKELRLLHVDDNRLTSVPSILKHVRRVRLAGNSFHCDCHSLWIRNWLLEHKEAVEDWAEVRCKAIGTGGWRNLTSVPDNQFVCQTSTGTAGGSLGHVAAPLTSVLALVTLCALAVWQRRRLKLLLYIHTGLHPFDLDPPHDVTAYDVTVVCSVSAREWALERVVGPLEGRGYRVLFYSRDALLGLTTLDNVRFCLDNSRRLVAVLGRNWVTDDVMVTATRQALARCRHKTVHFLTVVLHRLSVKDVGDKDVLKYIQGQRYIDAADKHFCHKLLYKMPRIKREAKTHRVKYAGEAVYLEITAKAVYLQTTAKDMTPTGLAADGIELEAERENMLACHEIDNSGHEYTENPADDLDLETMENIDVEANQDIRRKEETRLNVERQLNRENKEKTVPANRENVSVRLDKHNIKTNHRQPVDVRGSVHAERKSIFVWYADTDLPFTLKRIVEPLENRGHRCILQDRDFCVGAAIQENIVHASDTCARSVFVLSNQTARNEWFVFAFHVTFDRLLRCPTHRMVMVTREGVDVGVFVEEVQQVVKTSPVLGENDPWFQERLVKFVECGGMAGAL